VAFLTQSSDLGVQVPPKGWREYQKGDLRTGGVLESGVASLGRLLSGAELRGRLGTVRKSGFALSGSRETSENSYE